MTGIETIREDAAQRFASLGFPTVRDEEWRFTNVKAIAQTTFSPTQYELDDWRDVDLSADGLRLVFVNGHYSRELSSQNIPRRIRASSLQAANGVVSQHLAHYADYHDHAFVALNTALFQDGAWIEIPKGTIVEEPIHLVHLSSSGDVPVVSHPRCLIVIGPDSQATIVESYAGRGAQYFTNAVTEIVAGDHAVVDHYKLQQEDERSFHIATLHAQLGRDVSYSTHSISLGGGLVRNDVNVILAEGTEATVNGLYLASDSQHVDNHTAIDHAQPHGASHELYKGILAGKSTAVFNGKIIVRPGAQKTDAKQTNKNLILSEDATINTKPELQIRADDVRCTHGATIGQLDPEAIFYLQSRGIAREHARDLLTHAFARDIIDRLKVEPLGARLEQVLFENYMPAVTSLDVSAIRKDFPILAQQIHGKPLVYLDNAASSQKPKQVIDAITRFYLLDNANIHRGVHNLSERSTQAYEDARVKVQRFLNAADAREIVFVRGTTEAINLVTQSYGRKHVGAGDEIVISALEHHSNIVPWQMLCEEKGAALRVIPINDRGELELDAFERLLNPATKLVAVSHVSNALGTVNPVDEVIELAHRRNIPVLIDGAQAVPHMKVDVRDLDCDFYAFSGHKMFGPTGIGALYGKEHLLDDMPPYQGGGDMIRSVTFEKTTYNSPPHKFEAGTPDIAGVIGLGAAIDYLGNVGVDAVAVHEHELLEYGTAALAAISGVRLIGTARRKAGVLSFVLEGVHPHDVGTILDREGVAVRTGHHCAQPVMDRFGIAATTRASLALYNTKEDIGALVAGIRKVQEIFDV